MTFIRVGFSSACLRTTTDARTHVTKPQCHLLINILFIKKRKLYFVHYKEMLAGVSFRN